MGRRWLRSPTSPEIKPGVVRNCIFHHFTKKKRGAQKKTGLTSEQLLKVVGPKLAAVLTSWTAKQKKALHTGASKSFNMLEAQKRGVVQEMIKND